VRHLTLWLSACGLERDRGYERLGHRPKLPGAVTTEAGAGNPLQEVAASEAWAALAASNG